MKKRLFACLLAACLAVSVLVLPASAASLNNSAIQTAITLGAMDTSQTGSLDAAGIEQQFFGERGFACVRVRNNRKRAARGDLVGKWCHGGPFYGCARCEMRRKAAGDAGECMQTGKL